MKINFKRLSCLLIMLSLYCSQAESEMNDADELLVEGDVVRALEMYQRMNSDDPEIKGRIGFILSLDPVTMVNGMQMMASSIKKKPDFRLRRHLFLLYLQTELYEEADKLLDAEQISLERYFSPEISVMRKAFSCIQEKSDSSLKELTEARSSEAPWYTLLCLLYKIEKSAKKGKVTNNNFSFSKEYIQATQQPDKHLSKENTELFQLLSRSVSELERCEIHIFFAVDHLTDGMPIEQCREKYSQSLLLKRGRVSRLSGADFKRENRKLFDDSYYYPDHVPIDRPEYDPDYVAPWQEDAEESEIENYENYQRTRKEGEITNP